MDLSPLDRQLIGLLQRNARVSYQEMADQVGVSRTVVRTRVQHLLDSGTVRITGIPHPRTKGMPIAAELLVDTSLSAEQVATILGERPYQKIGYANGQPLVSLWCRDDAELTDLADFLRARPQTTGVEVFRVVHLLLPSLISPCTPEEPDLRDDLDHQLMELLAHDPRTPYTRLSEQIELSQAATRTRALRLLEIGAMAFEVTVHLDTPPVAASRIALRVCAPALAIALGLLKLPGLTYLAVGYGRQEILAYLATPPQTQHGLYQQLRHTPGISDLHVLHRTPDPRDAIALLQDLP